MALEMLIEEQKSIKNIIDEKIEQTKKWFRDKMEHVKDTFDKIKDKVLELFSKAIDTSKLDGKIGKNIEVEINGKKTRIVNENDTKASAIQKLKTFTKSKLGEVKKSGDDVIRHCQKGIRLLMGINEDDLIKDKIIKEVHVHKNTTMDGIKTVASIATAITASCGAYRNILVAGGMFLI